MTETLPCDVLILGAGPAGACLAVALRRAGIEDVVLVDRPARRPSRLGETGAPSLAPALRRLGIDARRALADQRPCHGNASLWGSSALALAEFMARPHGAAWHVDRPTFDRRLRQAAEEAGARLIAPAHLAGARRDGQFWQVAIRSGEAIVGMRARFIVDGTGRAAAFARRQGARLCFGDRLIALAARSTEPAERGLAGFSLVESIGHGWWYAARTNDGAGMVMLMTDGDIARAENLVAADAFARAWAGTDEIRRLVPAPRLAARPIPIDARTQWLDRAASEGWLALGDALTAFDPLTAAGLSGALEDADAAGAAIATQLDAPRGTRARAARAAYAARANETLERYWREAHGVYGTERRWMGAPFWQRRAWGHSSQNMSGRFNPK
jgi:flavin-dependent dehydrogenase